MQRRRLGGARTGRRRLPTCDAEYPRGREEVASSLPLLLSITSSPVGYRNAMAMLSSTRQSSSRPPRTVAWACYCKCELVSRPVSTWWHGMGKSGPLPWRGRCDTQARGDMTCVVSPRIGGPQVQVQVQVQVHTDEMKQRHVMPRSGGVLAVQSSPVQHSAAQHSTAQHSTALPTHVELTPQPTPQQRGCGVWCVGVSPTAVWRR